MNLASDLLQKVDSAGFPVKEVCVLAGVSPSTIAVLRRQKTGCSQRTYDLMIGALIKMVQERNQNMIEARLVQLDLINSADTEESLARNKEREAEGEQGHHA